MFSARTLVLRKTMFSKNGIAENLPGPSRARYPHPRQGFVPEVNEHFQIPFEWPSGDFWVLSKDQIVSNDLQIAQPWSLISQNLGAGQVRDAQGRPSHHGTHLKLRTTF